MNYEEKLQIIQTGCPKLRFSAQFTDQSSQWNYSRHAHPYLELLYFTEGGGGIDVSGQRLCATFFGLYGVFKTATANLKPYFFFHIYLF